MKKKNLKNISKYLSFILRHEPFEIKNKLKEPLEPIIDSDGYIHTENILKLCQISLNELESLVNSDNKNRYSFNEDKSKIRANQGHSTKEVDLKFAESTPRNFLYHGTSSHFLEAILKEGLQPMSRQYVHLSENIETAKSVGKRHGGELIILEINVKWLINDNYKMFLSENNVWLTKEIPPKYINVIKEDICVGYKATLNNAELFF